MFLTVNTVFLPRREKKEGKTPSDPGPKHKESSNIFSKHAYRAQFSDQFSLDNIIKSLDKNKDGSVSFDEFMMIVKKITSTGQ
uniref:Uncharacterized protein n=1 Tax=Geospiza parvula TaxID=87175 RepID=A0A8C3Q3A2_GEOPR